MKELKILVLFGLAAITGLIIVLWLLTKPNKDHSVEHGNIKHLIDHRVYDIIHHTHTLPPIGNQHRPVNEESNKQQ